MLMRTDCVPEAALIRQPARPRAAFGLRLLERIEGYFAHRRELKSLMALDDRMLKDIGLNRADVVRIVGSPYSFGARPCRFP